MKRLLLVDDNTEYLQFLSSVLSGDFNMKDGTGLNLLEDIRHRGIAVPFLLMSGNDDYLLVQQAKLYGGVFCCKTDYDLIAKIKALVSSES